MPEVCFTYEGIVKLLANLDTAKAVGPDAISPVIMKRCAQIFATYLVILFTQSLKEHAVPSEWKLANVVPIYKSGNRHCVENYRPVSLLSGSSKLMEHVIYSCVFRHLEDNSYFSGAQHGFRQGFSCVTQLIEFYHCLTLSFDKGLQTDVLFLDFRKAFDVVPHSFLIHKLRFLGIDRDVVLWIEDYLRGRAQRVVVNGEMSSVCCVNSGVPQGSVLGPLLFLIFINDITSNIDSQIRLFADDCVIYREIDSSEDSLKLQVDLQQIEVWCNKWGMSLNYSKCKAMHITRRTHRIEHHYTLSSSQIETVEEYKYLGVLISSNLRWTRHINLITAKAIRNLHFIFRNIRQAGRKAKSDAYITKIRPLLEYAATVWDPHDYALINKLERVQNMAARLVFNCVGENTSVTLLKERLGWESLSSRRQQLRLNLFADIFNEKTGIKKDLYLKPPSFISPRLDHHRKIEPYLCRTDVFRFSFFPKTINEWNSIDYH